jgi:hypothetical protein
MSEMSISMHGEETNLVEAIDTVFRDLQHHLNSSQCTLRNLSMCNERSDEFQVSHKYCVEIDQDLSEMLLLFKDLKSIVKQIKLKPENDEEKTWLNEFELTRKLEKEEEKRIEVIEKSLKKKEK